MVPRRASLCSVRKGQVQNQKAAIHLQGSHLIILHYHWAISAKPARLGDIIWLGQPSIVKTTLKKKCMHNIPFISAKFQSLMRISSDVEPESNLGHQLKRIGGIFVLALSTGRNHWRKWIDSLKQTQNDIRCYSYFFPFLFEILKLFSCYTENYKVGPSLSIVSKSYIPTLNKVLNDIINKLMWMIHCLRFESIFLSD